jgi:hypothetical protein
MVEKNPNRIAKRREEWLRRLAERERPRPSEESPNIMIEERIPKSIFAEYFLSEEEVRIALNQAMIDNPEGGSVLVGSFIRIVDDC